MTEEEIIRPENLVYKKPTLLNDTPMHYCPGCSHGVVHKLVAEVIEERKSLPLWRALVTSPANPSTPWPPSEKQKRPSGKLLKTP